METSAAILIGSGFATIGWLWTGRRSRHLARKQHTINVMLQASLNKDFRDAFAKVAEIKKGGPCPDLQDGKNNDARVVFQLVNNHYEFIAAGLRNGDFDEQLVRDSERGTILGTFEYCQGYIWKLRDSRRRQTIYEHLEWLHDRWEKNPPKLWQRAIERCRGRPFVGKRNNPRG